MVSKRAYHAPRLPQVHSQVQPIPENDLQYLRMTRSNLMLVFSGTCSSGLLYQARYTCHAFHSNITVAVDVFTEILISV